MIYFTTFIFTLLLAHIARAVPACGDAASPKDLYDPTYDEVQQPLLDTYKVTPSDRYDDPNGSTKSVDCSDGPNGLAHRYPTFQKIPGFPNIGAVFNVEPGSPNCGKCWWLYNKETNETIYLTAIQGTGTARTAFSIAKKGFEKLNGGKVGSGSLQAEAQPVSPSVCGFK
ncbi:Cerato-platanin-domain-containing protein [Russula emetica]|nr:Cerato-platanin-domain-containing protein [Russula emetica]